MPFDPISYALAKRALASAKPISPATIDHTKASYTLGAGGSTTLAFITGVGSTTILFSGDGDGVFRIRIFIDGSATPAEEFPTNEARISIHSFTSRLDIVLYNPGAASATASSASFNLRGVYM